jgi:eukaryotic-like serine/threonine-protein kinase
MIKELEANTTLLHYLIVSKIGAGGMGEVYLAQDTKLDRKVAIKFLNEQFSKHEDKLSRFVREARAASALNHPNILTVYEIGEVDGKNYIATELIDGTTLRQHLAQKEPLPLNTILKIGVQVSEALSAAHHAGIIHRDIKPENIMIRRDGYAKVLDFGLAKLSEPPALASGAQTGSEDATRIQINTNPGIVMGTVNYMSPEQASGNPTDARTDIWSLGVVLYEMLARKVPFTGATTSHTIVSILEKEPLALENVPGELQRIVRKALAKDVDMRYQSARDLLIDLKNLRRDLDIQGELERSTTPNRETATGSFHDKATQVYASGVLATRSGPAPAATYQSASASSLEYAVTQARSHKLVTAIVALGLLIGVATAGYFALVPKNGSKGQINSIAVLPFQNKSADPDTDYLSDGLAESLVFRLSQLPGLKVSPISSVMRYKDKNMDVAKIASELGVDTVMTGRLIKRGDNLNITVELVDTKNNKSLWGEQYERKMADLLATQREIASTIAEKLQLKLAGNEAKGITKRYTDSNEAYQLYLRGRYAFGKRTKDEMLHAVDYYQQAIKLDPKFAIAYARISETYGSMPAYPYLAPKDAFPQAKAAAQQALQIDPTLAEAHTFLAYSLAIYDWNWPEAETSFKRAIELDPNNATAHFRYGQIYLAATGRIDEAISEMKRGFDLEPLDINMGVSLAWAYGVKQQYDQELEQAKKTYDLEPNHPLGVWMLLRAYNDKGMYPESISLATQRLQTEPANQFVLREVGIAYAKAGRRDKAEEVIGRFRESAKTQYVPVCRIAAVYAALGDKDKALEELRKAFDDQDWELFRAKTDSYWIPLRDDPRFKDLLKRMNLPE